MSFKMSCPHCNRTLNLTEKAMGMIVPCPGCNQPVTVPQAPPSLPSVHPVAAEAPPFRVADPAHVASPPPMPALAPRIGGGSPTRFEIELSPQRRDLADTVRMSALLGIGFWLFWAVGFSFLFAAFENRSFEDVFPIALKTGILVGLLMAVFAPFSLVCVRATIRFSEKNDFVARLKTATSQLGYVAVSATGDSMTYRPSFKTAVDLLLGPTSVELEHDHAIMSGPKMHVKKIVKRLEANSRPA
jgi:hypothetical protein